MDNYCTFEPNKNQSKALKKKRKSLAARRSPPGQRFKDQVKGEAAAETKQVKRENAWDNTVYNNDVTNSKIGIELQTGTSTAGTRSFRGENFQSIQEKKSLGNHQDYF